MGSKGLNIMDKKCQNNRGKKCQNKESTNVKLIRGKLMFRHAQKASFCHPVDQHKFFDSAGRRHAHSNPKYNPK